MKLLLTIWSVTVATGLLSTAALATALESITDVISYGDHYAPGQVTSTVWRLGIPFTFCVAAANTCLSSATARPHLLELPSITAASLIGGVGFGLIFAALEKHNIIHLQSQSCGLSPARIRFVEALCAGTGICLLVLTFARAIRYRMQE